MSKSKQRANEKGKKGLNHPAKFLRRSRLGIGCEDLKSIRKLKTANVGFQCFKYSVNPNIVKRSPYDGQINKINKELLAKYLGVPTKRKQEQNSIKEEQELPTSYKQTKANITEDNNGKKPKTPNKKNTTKEDKKKNQNQTQEYKRRILKMSRRLLKKVKKK